MGPFNGKKEMTGITNFQQPWAISLTLAKSPRHLHSALVMGICLIFGTVLSQAVLAGSKAKERSNDKILERLNKAFAAFEETREAADDALVKGFDQAANAVRKNKSLDVGVKANLLAEITDAKVSFQVAGTLPTSDQLIPLSINYLDRLQPKIAAMQHLQHEALEKNLDDPLVFEEFKRRQQQWEASIPGAGELSTPARWHGRRVFRKSGGAVDFHLHVDSCENGILKGTLWQDAGNTWTKVGLSFEGRCQGNRVIFTTTNVLHGTARKFALAGYVIERRLVLKVISVNGKLAGDFVTLGK